MKARTGIVALLLFALPMFAYASCDNVKASIDAKIKANGVSSFTLAVVPADKADAAGKVVGQCEGDKKIVYTRGSAAAPADDKSAAPAQPAASSSSGS